MLEFIFKYTWIAMLVLFYIIWSIVSIKDIIKTVRLWKDQFDLDSLEQSSALWIITSVMVLFLASLAYWLYTSLGGVE
jgi:hypothetical protein